MHLCGVGCGSPLLFFGDKFSLLPCGVAEDSARDAGQGWCHFSGGDPPPKHQFCFTFGYNAARTMTKDLTEQLQPGYQWLDLLDPTEDELLDVARKFNLHEASVHDCLQPGHLPKYEKFKGYTFIIFRVYTGTWDAEADTVQELTNKVAIFIAEGFIVTIHRVPWAAISEISGGFMCGEECRHTSHILVELVKKGLHTFDEPATKLNRQIEFYERQVFLKNRKGSILKGLYFLKRTIDVIRRLILLSYDIVDKLDGKENSDALSRDCRDLYVKQQSLFDALTEQSNQLLNVYFNISSQRTNETMRVLTIFSVFFMPLTFIVGVYGMNFHFMPELDWKWGYPAAWLLMVVVTLGVYLWFRQKKWL